MMDRQTSMDVLTSSHFIPTNRIGYQGPVTLFKENHSLNEASPIRQPVKVHIKPQERYKPISKSFLVPYFQ